MKATKIFTAVITAMLTLSTVQAAEIPRESAPLNATEEQIVIVENLICDILDEVAAGQLGYTEAAGAANTRVRKAVVAGETNGHGYGILSPIAQNAILDMRDTYLRPDAYRQAEDELRILLADLLMEVSNGKDIVQAQKEAYILIYRLQDDDFDPDNYSAINHCYWDDTPTVDRRYFNRARWLINEAAGIRN